MRERRPAARAIVLVAACLLLDHAAAAPRDLSFDVPQPAEVIARITMACEGCAWGVAGREAVLVRVSVDGRYSQHLPVLRAGRATYDVLLGPLAAGAHMLRLDEDPDLTARELRGGHATVAGVTFDHVVPGSPAHSAVSRAPIVYARPNTVGRFTDLPAFMWYEEEPTARGTRYRYSVIFTNEDGGTPTDRLMATWGRTTDIEYLYSVEVDARGTVVADDFQGPDHEVRPFAGGREGGHPLLWVSTENNMVLDQGATRVRYAPAPVAFPLRDVSREAVMDAHPWLYAIMAQELQREGKMVADAAPGAGTIPDPRRFVYLDACGEVGRAALAFAVRAGGQWVASDRGVREYRIVRDGCFRVAVPLPAGVDARAVTGIRAQAYRRPATAPAAASPPVGPVLLTRLNTVFMLDAEYRPGAPLFQWQGRLALTPDGPPVEIPVP